MNMYIGPYKHLLIFGSINNNWKRFSFGALTVEEYAGEDKICENFDGILMWLIIDGNWDYCLCRTDLDLTKLSMSHRDDGKHDGNMMFSFHFSEKVKTN